MDVPLLGRRVYVTRFNPDECATRVRGLNGYPPQPYWSAIHSLVTLVHTDVTADSFDLRIGTARFSPSGQESFLALRGHWSPLAEGTRIEAGYRLRSWVVVIATLTAIVVGLLILLDALWANVYRVVVDRDGAVGELLALLIAVELAVVALALGELGGDRIGKLLADELQAVRVPDGADAAQVLADQTT